MDTAMARDDLSAAPPGTRIAPRDNLGPAGRGASLLAGALLGAAGLRRGGAGGVAMGLAASALLARGVTGTAPLRRALAQTPEERAFARAAGWKSAALVSRSVTINAPPQEVQNLLNRIGDWPAAAQNILAAQALGRDHWRLTVADPSGPVTFDAVCSRGAADGALTLTSVPGTPVPTMARFAVREAPAGRGSEVHALIAYQPPGGSLGRYAAKLSQREPGIQLRRDLKRFKSLIETGEIATNAPQGTEPKA
jgi:uncharacterized membrane protein